MNSDTVKSKFVRGSGYVLVSRLASKAVSFFGQIFLARVLLPGDFGTYGVAVFIVSFFASIFSLGLPAALLQKRSDVTDDELNSFFTLQLTAALAVWVAVWFLAPACAAYYPSSQITPGYIRLFAFSIVFVAVKSYALVLLERKLDYKPVAVVDFVEITGFNAATIGLAAMGFGPWAFVYGVIASRVVGLIAAVIAVKRLPRFAFNWKPLIGSLSFGLYIQLGGIMNLFREALVPIFIGKQLGLESMGYINWAVMLCSYPMVAVGFMDRTAFTALSRVQHDPEAFRRAVLKISRVINVVVFAGLAVILGNIQGIIHFIFTDKWTPAEPLVYAYGFNVAMYASGNLVSSAFNAMGKSRVPFIQSLWWFFFHWGAGVYFVNRFGMIGYGYMVASCGLGHFVLYWYFHKVSRVNLWPSFQVPVVAGILAGISGHMWSMRMGMTAFNFAGSIAVTGAVYCAVLWLFDQKEISAQVTEGIRVFFPRRSKA